MHSAGVRDPVRAARDLGAIVAMIRALAEYERLAHLCTATERPSSFAVRTAPAAEVLIS